MGSHSDSLEFPAAVAFLAFIFFCRFFFSERPLSCVERDKNDSVE